GAPVASFHHIDLFAPGSDTVMVEHDLDVKRGDVEGRRRVGRRNGDVQLIPVSKTLPAGAVRSRCVLCAAAGTNLAAGESLPLPAAVGLVALAPAQLAAQGGRISYESFALPNGLRVVYSEDHSTPIVTVDLWYRVGSRNERPGRGGFAHLFEHLMFQGSAHVK